MRPVFSKTTRWKELEKEGPEAMLEDVLKAIKSLAIDGYGPTIKRWNEQRPDHLPTIKYLKKKLGIDDWPCIVSLAGLKSMPSGPRESKVQTVTTADEIAFVEEIRDAAVPDTWKTEPMIIVVHPNESFFDRRWNTSTFDYEVVEVFRGEFGYANGY